MKINEKENDFGNELEKMSKRDEIIHAYCCNDPYGEYCSNNCKECEKEIAEMLDDFEKEIKESAIIFTEESLKKHDSELLDNVAEKLKSRVMICANCETIGCDTLYFQPMCEKAKAGIFATEFSEYVDEVIAEMKAEESK